MAKKAISFGLVHIPILLNPIIKNNDTAFNQLHKKCGTKIKYEKICPHCDVEVKSEDLMKGYEYTTDQYVIFEEEDFNKIQLCDECPIEIISFINLKEIDPVYYEKSYFLTTKGTNKAFDLFKAALKKVGKVALAKTVIGTKFYYVIIRFEKNNIIMNTLYFDEEVNLDQEAELKKFDTNELNMATKLIEAMSGKFEPEKYKDEYQKRIKEAIEQKITGKEIIETKTEPKKAVADLMEALKLSLDNIKK